MLTYLNDLIFTLPYPFPLVVVCLFVAVVAFAAWKAGGLDAGGAAFAFLFGVSVLWITRLEGFLLYFIFYISCMIVGRFKEKGGEHKHETRTWVQVVANGLMAVIGVFMFAYGSKYGLLLFASATAEAASDTWAGEIGRLSPSQPVSIMTFRPMDKGMSGGVTMLGFIGGFLGSLLIAFFYVDLFSASLAQGIIVLAAGFSGCVLDSVLGASVQALYYDDEKNKYTEDPHFRHVRGLTWVDNSMVNFLSNLFASVLALGLGKLL